MEVASLGRGGVVASAFGDVQVVGVLDGSADSGQVRRAAAGPASGGIFTEGHVPDVVVRRDGPVLADRPGRSWALASALVKLVTA